MGALLQWLDYSYGMLHHFQEFFFFLAYMKGNPKQESVPIETQILYTDKCWIKRMYY